MTKYSSIGDADTDGYHVYVMSHDYSTDYPSAFKTYVRIPRSNVDGVLADSILKAVLVGDEKFRLVFEPATHVSSAGWNRRLANCGPVDEFSDGVQAMYFSPNGQVVCIFAYIDAEWMDE